MGAAVPNACNPALRRPELPIDHDVSESETETPRDAVVIMLCDNVGWVEADFGASQDVWVSHRLIGRFRSAMARHWRQRTARKCA
jgi:hypothetical protein